MKTAPHTSKASRGRTRAFLVALFAAVLLLAPAPPVFAGSGPRGVWAPIEWALGSQRRMLQVGSVGMCLAIYLIMWRK